MTNSSSYLDTNIPTLEGGICTESILNNSHKHSRPYIYSPYISEDDVIEQSEKTAYRIYKCGATMPNKRTGLPFVLSCKNLICEKCGGAGNRIHRGRYAKVLKHIPDRIKYCRCIVFTLPSHLRDLFRGKYALNEFFGIAERLTKRFFGTVTHTKHKKKGDEKVYSLDKPAVAVIHLFGRTIDYNPHINVIIFEHSSVGNNLKLSRDTLNSLRISYRRELERFLCLDIPDVDFNYSYRTTEKKVRGLVWYMTKPFEPVLFRSLTIEEDLFILDDLMVNMKNLRHLRFWGQSSNSKYRKYLLPVGAQTCENVSPNVKDVEVDTHC